VVIVQLGHHLKVHGRGELQTLGASLEEVLARVTALVDETGPGTSRDDEQELVAIERGLASVLRRVRRLAAREEG
jgi:hypothetical protein